MGPCEEVGEGVVLHSCCKGYLQPGKTVGPGYSHIGHGGLEGLSGGQQVGTALEQFGRYSYVHQVGETVVGVEPGALYG